MKNGVLTNNVIPDSYISPIAKAQQQFMPSPTNPATLVNNYTAALAQGFDNQVYNYRVDFQMTPNHRISTVGRAGFGEISQQLRPALSSAALHRRRSSEHLSEGLRCSGRIHHQQHHGEPAQVRLCPLLPEHRELHAERSHLPDRKARHHQPSRGSGGTKLSCGNLRCHGKFGNAIQTWQAQAGTIPSSATATQQTTPNNYALVDNLQWVKGSHTLDLWHLHPVAADQQRQSGNLYRTSLVALQRELHCTVQGASLTAEHCGYAYASFLLGAVGNATVGAAPSLGLQPVSELGGRYRPIAPYVGDTWKVNSKLTVDAGLRWDYLPPYHEVKDRWSFMNPNLTNPVTGTPGSDSVRGQLWWRRHQLQLPHSGADLLEELGTASRRDLRCR